MSLASWWTAFLSQPAPYLFLVIALCAAFLMGFSRSGIGAGGFVVSPLMVLALGSSVGLAVVAVLMLPAAFTGYWQHRKDAEPKLLRPLVLAAFVGTSFGGLLVWLMVSGGELALVHRRLELVVALLSLLYVALVLFRERIANLAHLAGSPTFGGLFATGTAIGISQTVANSGSPLLTVYFLCYRIGREQFVGAQVTFLLVQNLLKLLPLVLLGVLHLGNATVAIALMPVTFLGSWLGHRFYKRADEKTFFVLYAALLVIGFVASLLLIFGRSRLTSLIA